MSKLKILLTGSTGFIGKNIFEQLKGKYHITAPSHKELDLTDTSTVDSFFKKSGPFDVVIHCANIGGKRNDNIPKGILETNLGMFFNLVRNKRYFKKMIHIGTGAEYDKSRDLLKVKESDFGKFIPQNEHAFYKYICSKYIENSKDIYCFRLFGIFGKYEDYRIRFISNIICKYILKQPLTILQNAYFDYLYVDDFIRIMDYFIGNKAKYNFYNLGTGKRTSLLSLAKIINKLDKYSLQIKILKNGLNKEYTCNNTRLKNEVRGFKFKNIENSINELYQWHKENIDKIDKKSIIEDKFNRV